MSISLGAMPKRRIAIKEEAPQSTKNVLLVALTRIQVCKRPPLPNASPLPKNLTWIVFKVGTPQRVKSHKIIVGQSFAQSFTLYNTPLLVMDKDADRMSSIPSPIICMRPCCIRLHMRGMPLATIFLFQVDVPEQHP